MRYTLRIELEEERCSVLLLDESGKEADAETLEAGLGDFALRLNAYVREVAEHKAGAGMADAEEEIARAAAEAVGQLALLAGAGQDIRDLQAISVVHAGGREYPVTLSGKVAEEIVIDLIRKILAMAEEVYDRNLNLAAERLSCPGESLWAYLVRAGLSRRFGDIPVDGGTEQQKGPDAATTAEYSYGILFAEDYEADPNRRVILNLVRKGSPLPARGSCVCYAARASHRLLWFDLYRSGFSEASYSAGETDKTYLGRAEFRLPPDGKEITEVSCSLLLSETADVTMIISDENGSRMEMNF